MDETAVTRVSAALIWEGERFLVCQRPEGKKRGLLWEFVGGKVEPGESGEEALVRECEEELGITVRPERVFMEVTHEYPDLTVRLTLYTARILKGEPKLLEHKALKWIRIEEAGEFDFCPADTEILERLRRYAGNCARTECGGMSALTLLPESGSVRLAVWLHEDFETACRIRELLSVPDAALVLIGGTDWDADLSPWPAKGVFPGSSGFSGGAEAHLKSLTELLIPAVERRICPGTPVRRVIAGYSLAGLFALWSSAVSDRFDACAAVSGSFWYDGFADWFREKTPQARYFYLSVGDKEKNARNPRMARVEQAGESILEGLSEKGIPAVFEKNPGGHFRDVAERMACGIGCALGFLNASENL